MLVDFIYMWMVTVSILSVSRLDMYKRTHVFMYARAYLTGIFGAYKSALIWSHDAL